MPVNICCCGTSGCMATLTVAACYVVETPSAPTRPDCQGAQSCDPPAFTGAQTIVYNDSAGFYNYWSNIPPECGSFPDGNFSQVLTYLRMGISVPPMECPSFFVSFVEQPNSLTDTNTITYQKMLDNATGQVPTGTYTLLSSSTYACGMGVLPSTIVVSASTSCTMTTTIPLSNDTLYIQALACAITPFTGGTPADVWMTLANAAPYYSSNVWGNNNQAVIIGGQAYFFLADAQYVSATPGTIYTPADITGRTSCGCGNCTTTTCGYGIGNASSADIQYRCQGELPCGNGTLTTIPREGIIKGLKYDSGGQAFTLTLGALHYTIPLTSVLVDFGCTAGLLITVTGSTEEITTITGANPVILTGSGGDANGVALSADYDETLTDGTVCECSDHPLSCLGIDLSVNIYGNGCCT